MSAGADGAMQAIGAEQQDIVGVDVMLGGIDCDEHVIAERAAEDVAGGRLGCLLRGEYLAYAGVHWQRCDRG